MLIWRLEPSFLRNIIFLQINHQNPVFLSVVYFLQQKKNLTFAPKLVLNVSD